MTSPKPSRTSLTPSERWRRLRRGSARRRRTPPTTSRSCPRATVAQVEQAEADLDAAFEGVTEDTPLSAATEQVSTAAFAVQVAWLRLFADAGCLTDDQQQNAVPAVSEYTAALQSA